MKNLIENYQEAAVYCGTYAKYMETEEGEDTLMDLETEFLNNLLEDYSVMLQNQSEYLMSDEAVKETLISNEYDFTEAGEIY